MEHVTTHNSGCRQSSHWVATLLTDKSPPPDASRKHVNILNTAQSNAGPRAESTVAS